MLKMQQAEEKIRTGYEKIKEISLTDQENSISAVQEEKEESEQKPKEKGKETPQRENLEKEGQQNKQIQDMGQVTLNENSRKYKVELLTITER